MKGKHNPFVAREGIPFLIAAIVAAALIWHFTETWYTVFAVLAGAWLYLVFRDPVRATPAVPLGVISPVDGTVVDSGLTDAGALGGEAQKVLIRVNMLGTYTARCPVEGKIMDFRGADPNAAALGTASGLWIRTDEDHDVVLQFHGHRLGFAPLAFIGYGERVGQGQRCAYLRLARLAEVQLPINARVLVSKGQKVSAGVDVLAKLPHP